MRTRLPAKAGIIVLTLAAGPGPPTAAAPQGIERSVLVTVLDRDGDAIRDLDTADFTLAEGDEARTVTRAALSDEPLYAVVVVDTTQPPGQTRQILDLRDAVGAFVSRLRAANPDGRIALIESAGAAVVTGGFDESARALDARIDHLAPVREIESGVLEALRTAGRMVGEAAGRRRAIVCVDFDSDDPRGVTPDEVAAAVEQTGAAFWSISVRTSGRASPPREALMNYLPARTGGLRQTIILSRPLPEMLRQLARTLTSQYIVTFRRPVAAPVTTVVPGVSRGATVLMSPWIR
jgi:hypothetical protein